MEPEMMKKMEAVKGNLAGKFVGKATEMAYTPGFPDPRDGSDDCCEDREDREDTVHMLKRMVQTKSDRLDALKQLAHLYAHNHIERGCALDRLIYEWLGRERRF